MGKRGPKPGFNLKKRVSEKWTSNLAYAVGLLASDGCLSPPGHLIDLTSKDREQLLNYIKCLGIPLNITHKYSGQKKYLRVQFKSVLFYNFLLSVGLTPAKSRTLGQLKIPPHLFWDFLRGVFDGDGCTYSYWDKRWRSSYMFYTVFGSASKDYINWLQKIIEHELGLRGHITSGGENRGFWQLKYAKVESLSLLRKMYQRKNSIYLSRKRLKIDKMLRIVDERL